MTTETATNHTDPGRRHDFVLLFDVRDGNPNGDPDAGNAPRLDPDTMHGLVTDVAIKRKVRDYVDAARGAEQRYKIYVQRESYLTDTRARVFGDHSDGSDPEPATAREWMCDEFYDVRMFGAVMSMREKNSGQVRGPAQFTFARSIDPILHLEHTIGRVALETRGERAEQRDGDERQAPTHGTLGRKSTVPYEEWKTIALGAGVTLALGLAGWARARWNRARNRVHDPLLIKEKVSRIAFEAELQGTSRSRTRLYRRWRSNACTQRPETHPNTVAEQRFCQCKRAATLSVPASLSEDAAAPLRRPGTPLART